MNIDDLVKVEISGSGIILDKEETCSSECRCKIPTIESLDASNSDNEK